MQGGKKTTIAPRQPRTCSHPIYAEHLQKSASIMDQAESLEQWLA